MKHPLGIPNNIIKFFQFDASLCRSFTCHALLCAVCRRRWCVCGRWRCKVSTDESENKYLIFIRFHVGVILRCSLNNVPSIIWRGRQPTDFHHYFIRKWQHDDDDDDQDTNEQQWQIDFRWAGLIQCQSHKLLSIRTQLTHNTHAHKIQETSWFQFINSNWGRLFFVTRLNGSNFASDNRSLLFLNHFGNNQNKHWHQAAFRDDNDDWEMFTPHWKKML